MGPAAAPTAAAACRLSVLALLALLACGDSEPAPPSGEVLFARHCAACHGLDGRGDGPMATSLRTAPTDLTRLAEGAGGSFDTAAVMAVIDGRREVAAHGPREMPVWGAVFEAEVEAGQQPYGWYVGLLHSRALAEYLATLQR